MSIVVDGIGELVTNDPSAGPGPLGIVRRAAVAIEDRMVAAIGPAGTLDADERIDVGGASVLPGFVDSHTHLVFDGDRAAEFSARMGGEPYRPAGIAATVAATTAADDTRLFELARGRRAAGASQGTTHMEIKSGYALTVEGERRLLTVAGRLTDDTTFLGAHVVPASYEDRRDEYVDLVTGPMLRACAPTARWIDVFCERGAFDADQSRRILEAGRAAGLGLRVHANQLGPGPGAALAAELGAASADHCTHLTDEDVTALVSARVVVAFLPAADYSTRQPYPNARRVLDAGGTVAIASNCNPGSSNTTSIPFCLGLAVREMGMTTAEAVTAATRGGAAALRRDDIGWLGVGARADLQVLDAPEHTHLIYRPGMQLTTLTIAGGDIVYRRPEPGDR